MGIANVFAKSTIPTPICVLIGGTLNFLGLALVRGWHGSDQGRASSCATIPGSRGSDDFYVDTAWTNFLNCGM